MKYYIELTLIENSQKNLYSLWTQVYTQMHLAFVECKDQNNRIHYGVSFPNYFFNDKANIGILGDKLRIFANTKEELLRLALPKWLNRLLDYVHIQAIKEVPSRVDGYAIYQRYQSKGDSRMEKTRREYAEHYAQLNSLSFEDAIKRYAHWEKREVTLPYIQMKSLQSGQKYKIFIDKKSIDSDINNNQLFTTYGLSAGGIVPEF